MEIGRLSSHVTLQSPSTKEDEIGQPIPGWADVATVWADIRHQGGLEAIKSGADVSIVRASARIRYRSDVTAAMRLVFGATVYSITAVLPDQRRKYLDLVCEVVA